MKLVLKSCCSIQPTWGALQSYLTCREHGRNFVTMHVITTDLCLLGSAISARLGLFMYGLSANKLVMELVLNRHPFGSVFV